MNVLALSPHTDDIELGAGGTIVKLLENNHRVIWVVFSTCEESVPKGMPLATLKDEFLTIASKLGIKDYNIFNFGVKHFPIHRQEILNCLDDLKETYEPSLVICPSVNDFHQDHKTVTQEAIREFKKDTTIIGYEEPWNNLVFRPQLFVRLTEEQIQKKWEMLGLYKSQFILKRPYFSKECTYGTAAMRGSMCNSKYAEAFEVIRWMK